MDEDPQDIFSIIGWNAKKGWPEANERSFEAKEIFANKVVALFFGAQWCQYCRKFKPKLKEATDEINKYREALAVIYIPNDYTEGTVKEMLKDTNWYRIPLGNSAIDELTELYDIAGLPTLIVLDQEGNIVDRKARNTIEIEGAHAIVQWNTLIKEKKNKICEDEKCSCLFGKCGKKNKK